MRTTRPRLTLRQLYCQLVARDLIPNQQVWYKRLGEVVSNGLDSWELDALDPAVLDGLVSDAIEQFLDQDLYDAMLEREEADKAAIRAAAAALGSGG